MENKTYVAIVLDESGSMNFIAEEIIQGFNEQIDAIKEGATDCLTCKSDIENSTKVSLVKFATDVPKPIYWNNTVQQINKLTIDDYRPSGLTAMLDAVGYTIDNLLKAPDANDKNVSFLVVIISDGNENNSKKENFETIQQKIVELQGTDRWTFTYMGANQDLSEISKTMGIPISNTTEWANTKEGTMRANTVSSSSMTNYMASRSMGVSSISGYYTESVLNHEDTFVIPDTENDIKTST